MSDRLDAELYDGPEAIHAAQRAEIARLRALLGRIARWGDDSEPVEFAFLTDEGAECPWCGGYRFDGNRHSPANSAPHGADCPWLALLAEASKETP